jgi:hypothetical protein
MVNLLFKNSKKIPERGKDYGKKDTLLLSGFDFLV